MFGNLPLRHLSFFRWKHPSFADSSWSESDSCALLAGSSGDYQTQYQSNCKQGSALRERAELWPLNHGFTRRPFNL